MKKRENKNNEALGISGFTLAIVGYFSLIFTGIFTLVYFIVGLIFCIVQQKRKKTKLGRIGLILNIIGIVATIIISIIFIIYLYPLLQDQLQNFPTS